MKPELLLFDLGGVLVDFSGPRDLAQFMRTPASPADLLERWAACPHTTAYEGGRISADEWAERFVRDWELTLTPSGFLAEFTTWSRGFFPGAVELLAALRPRYRLGALSNSNPLHWNRNREVGILQNFDIAIGSHEVGCCKPAPAIFQVVLERGGVNPEAVVFFDDLPANVAGAAASGIRAFCVDGLDALRERLVSERLL